MVFHLPLRQTEGFLRCLAELLKIDVPIPDHTTLSRRLKNLSDIQFRRLPTDRPIHVLIDSTGLRIHVGHIQHPPRYKAWRKLHLAVDADTGEIVASDLTVRRKHDCTQVPPLLGQISDPIAPFSADGAYDTRAVYEAAHERGKGQAIRVLIPPGRDAQLSSHPSVEQQERNRNIRSIRELGRRGWHTFPVLMAVPEPLALQEQMAVPEPLARPERMAQQGLRGTPAFRDRPVRWEPKDSAAGRSCSRLSVGPPAG
jgi:IS5 family transposase